MGFFDNLGKSIVNSAKSELQYELQRGVRQGIQSAISNGEKAMSKNWRCSCGAMNNGKFCKNCGKERNAVISVCKKCGWSSDGSNVKFALIVVIT
jgi:membrane protease subunit (stomatin/prohibitin family)